MFVILNKFHVKVKPTILLHLPGLSVCGSQLQAHFFPLLTCQKNIIFKEGKIISSNRWTLHFIAKVAGNSAFFGHDFQLWMKALITQCNKSGALWHRGIFGMRLWWYNPSRQYLLVGSIPFWFWSFPGICSE